MRSLRFDLMSCERRLKIPIVLCPSSKPATGLRGLLFREIREQRHMLCQREVDLVECRFELVEIEILELERARENDPLVVDAVARVHERLGVQLEELTKESRGLPFWHVADVDPQDHERRVDSKRNGRVLLAGADEKRSPLAVDGLEPAVQPPEVRLDVVQAPHRILARGAQTTRSPAKHEGSAPHSAPWPRECRPRREECDRNDRVAGLEVGCLRGNGADLALLWYEGETRRASSL